jgi:hypothetical protein
MADGHPTQTPINLLRTRGCDSASAVPTAIAPCACSHLAGKLLGLHQEVAQVVLEGGELLVLKHARHARHDLRQERM